MKMNRTKIIFYIASAIFLMIGAFQIFYTYTGLAQTAETQGLALSENISSVIAIYVQQCVPYFAYAFLCYGLGMVIEKVEKLGNVMSLCIQDAEEYEKEKD